MKWGTQTMVNETSPARTDTASSKSVYPQTPFSTSSRLYSTAPVRSDPASADVATRDPPRRHIMKHMTTVNEW